MGPDSKIPERVDTARLMRTRSGHYCRVVLVMVLTLTLTALEACGPKASTAVPETAVTAEIDQLLDDYIAAWNAYDADALRPLLADGFMWYMTNSDPKQGVSTGASGTKDLAETLSYCEGSALLNRIQYEWVGEPITTGDGPWLASRSWHYTSENYEYPEARGISTYTVVDEDGTLKLARAIEVGFDVE
ncbi:MAG: hypothetical protein PVH41_17355 [Anaerolineae bacterium]